MQTAEWKARNEGTITSLHADGEHSRHDTQRNQIPALLLSSNLHPYLVARPEVRRRCRLAITKESGLPVQLERLIVAELGLVTDHFRSRHALHYTVDVVLEISRRVGGVSKSCVIGRLGRRIRPPRLIRFLTRLLSAVSQNNIRTRQKDCKYCRSNFHGTSPISPLEPTVQPRLRHLGQQTTAALNVALPLSDVKRGSIGSTSQS
jgi:hypothetical protein